MGAIATGRPGNHGGSSVVERTMGRGRLRILLAVLLAVAWSFGGADPAAACSCASLTDAEAFAHADVVFEATLLEVRTPTPTGDTWSSADPERFVFAVDHVYKGHARAEQSVVTAREGASCGLELAGTGPFLVFANEGDDGLTHGSTDGELTANLCGGSHALTGAVPVALGEAGPPVAGRSPVGTGSDPDPPVGWYAPGAIALVLAAAGGWRAVARRGA